MWDVLQPAFEKLALYFKMHGKIAAAQQLIYADEKGTRNNVCIWISCCLSDKQLHLRRIWKLRTTFPQLNEKELPQVSIFQSVSLAMSGVCIL